MKLKTLALRILSVVLSVLFSSCGVVGQKTDSGTSVTKPAVAGEILVPKPKKDVKVNIGNGQCTAEFEEQPDGKIKKDSLNILTGACKKYETESLMIGGKEVLDIGAVEFILKGSCEYCWINSVGGMSCIVWPGC